MTRHERLSSVTPVFPAGVTTSVEPLARCAGWYRRHGPIARVSGEAFDADQITPNCEECGKNEYACLCDDPWGYGPEPKKSREQIETDYCAALDRIARVFLGVAK